MSQRKALSSRAADRRLLERYHRTGDTAARDALVARYERVIRHLARRYDPRGEQHDDLCQVAMLGLLQAIERFDPDRGTEFGTFATPTIVGELKRYFRSTGWVVHVPRRQQELALTVARAGAELERDLGRPPTPGEIARRTELTTEEVVEGRQVMHARYGVPLESSGNDEEPRGAADSHGVVDDGFSRVEDALALEQLLSVLPSEQQQLVHMRYRDELKQREIAARVGVSEMEISRRVRRAVGDLRDLADAA